MVSQPEWGTVQLQSYSHHCSEERLDGSFAALVTRPSEAPSSGGRLRMAQSRVFLTGRGGWLTRGPAPLLGSGDCPKTFISELSLHPPPHRSQDHVLCPCLHTHALLLNERVPGALPLLSSPKVAGASSPVSSCWLAWLWNVLTLTNSGRRRSRSWSVRVEKRVSGGV